MTPVARPYYKYVTNQFFWLLGVLSYFFLAQKHLLDPYNHVPSITFSYYGPLWEQAPFPERFGLPSSNRRTSSDETNTTDALDYDLFWKNALEEALANNLSGLWAEGTNLGFNAAQADLFFVPLWTEPKSGSQWRGICGNASNGVHHILPELVHLTPATACRHFFTYAKGHYNGKHCLGWFAEPVPSLQHAQRIAYSHVDRYPLEYVKDDERYPANDTTLAKIFPNLASVPYASHFHWNKDTPVAQAPWTQFHRRPILMQYLGKTNHGDKKVRTRMAALCQSYHNERICPSSIDFDMTRLRDKARTVFCLEPVGDSPWRRSLADSISMGCIPVLFSPRTDASAPWSWGEWKVQARVLIPRGDFVGGKVDLYRLLSSIPLELLELMQWTIAKYGRQFLYSLDDDPQDGIWRTLYGLEDHAERLEAQGHCAV